MSVKYMHSITEIKKEHCYETRGSRPIRVFCSDFLVTFSKVQNFGKVYPKPLFAGEAVHKQTRPCFLSGEGLCHGQSPVSGT